MFYLAYLLGNIISKTVDSHLSTWSVRLSSTRTRGATDVWHGILMKRKASMQTTIGRKPCSFGVYLTGWYRYRDHKSHSPHSNSTHTHTHIYKLMYISKITFDGFLLSDLPLMAKSSRHIKWNAEREREKERNLMSISVAERWISEREQRFLKRSKGSERVRRRYTNEEIKGEEKEEVRDEKTPHTHT